MLMKKTVKAYVMSLCLFLVLTIILAAVIRFTAFDEDWAFPGLTAAMSVSALFLGMLEGRITGKRGLLTGLAAAVVLVLIILFAAGGVFAGEFGINSFHPLYAIAVLAGGAGGIIGANSSSS